MNELKLPTSPNEAVVLVRTLYGNRVMRFAAVGGSCGLVQLAVLHLLVAGFGAQELLANFIAFVISMELNFTLNQLFTWRDRWSSELTPQRFVVRVLMFNASASTTGIPLNQGIAALMSLFMWYLPAAAIGICVAATANFFLSDRLVFRLWSSGGASATIGEP
ncbi:MAG: GtrA family protein [Dehalococcoidia bacterium]|jgi:putative flippase GtrA